MKKFMLVFLALIFVFSACGKDEVPDKIEKEKTSLIEKKTEEEKEEEPKKLEDMGYYSENTARLLPPEYYAKGAKISESRNDDLPDGRLYDALYLDFEGKKMEHNFSLSYDGGEGLKSCYVTLVTELLFNGTDDRACHIYLKSEEDLPDNFPSIDWYVVEKGEEVFRFPTEDAYLAYKYAYGLLGSSEVPALYVGGEDLVQLGSIEDGFMIDGRQRRDMGYCMLYTYPFELGGDEFYRNEAIEEFIWMPEAGLNGYNFREQLDNGDIYTMSLHPAKENK